MNALTVSRLMVCDAASRACDVKWAPWRQKGGRRAAERRGWTREVPAREGNVEERKPLSRRDAGCELVTLSRRVSRGDAKTFMSTVGEVADDGRQGLLVMLCLLAPTATPTSHLSQYPTNTNTLQTYASKTMGAASTGMESI